LLLIEVLRKFGRNSPSPPAPHNYQADALPRCCRPSDRFWREAAVHGDRCRMSENGVSSIADEKTAKIEVVR
jgi:hypothetical protein